MFSGVERKEGWEGKRERVGEEKRRVYENGIGLVVELEVESVLYVRI